MKKIKIIVGSTKYKELLSIFSAAAEIPFTFSPKEIISEFLTEDMLCYQKTLIYGKIFDDYDVKSTFFAWLDMKKIKERTGKYSGKIVITIDGEYIRFRAGKSKYRQKLIDREKPDRLFEFDKNGVPEIENTTYDTVASLNIPKGSIFSQEVDLQFSNGKVILGQRDFDSEGEDEIGKYESTEDAEGDFVFTFYGEILKDMKKTLEQSKTKYILSSNTTNRPMSCVTVSKDFRNYLLLLPIAKTDEEVPAEIKQMRSAAQESDDDDDDFDLDYDEDEDEEGE